MKKRIILVIGFVFIFLLISKNSFASPVIDDNIGIDLVLLNKGNVDEIKSDIFKYIDLVDNNLIPNSSFNISNKLNENYDFLTRFAISFILDNEDDYNVIYGDNYVYTDGYGKKFTSNKYINVDTIYDITSQVFGIEYYYILNEFLELEGEMVPLLEINEYDFDMNIESIKDIHKGNGYYDVTVKYEDVDLYYIYRFEKLDNRLVISNLSIKE